MPAPDVAAEVLAQLEPDAAPLSRRWPAELRRRPARRSPTPRALGQVPEHLRITFRVLADGAPTLAEGKDLDASCGASCVGSSGQPVGRRRRRGAHRG